MLHKQNFNNASIFAKLSELENKIKLLENKVEELEREIKETKEMNNKSLSCSTFSDSNINEFHRHLAVVVSYDMLDLQGEREMI